MWPRDAELVRFAVEAKIKKTDVTSWLRKRKVFGQRQAVGSGYDWVLIHAGGRKQLNAAHLTLMLAYFKAKVI